ncbi:GIY-YIG nuclease family protein [Saccharothrix syringae]|uniref:Uncharacterized protein n=1 Tax=Saccharothrix syringae TaxID=103733 RepID=A0A5Q0GWD8_SACSY|nr:GIY-YIG nuclease family protein [Saccharothrix syringae]QFZ17824.1 hypothetical protein EKG83_10320 [Saccharothrix syringae]
MRNVSVQEFAESLRELHVTCGKPSYAKICGLARGHALSPPTISEVLNGKRMPKVEFVVSFVRAVLRHRDGADLGPRHDAEVRRWRLRWQQAQLAPRACRPPRGRPSARPADREPPARVPPTTRQPVAPANPHPVDPPLADPHPVDPALADPHPVDPAAADPIRWDPNPVDRVLLDRALSARDARGRRWSEARHGCWALYDPDGNAVHIGQTDRTLAAAVREHLADPGTARLLEAQEVAELELWPAWGAPDQPALDRLERAVWRRALGGDDDLPPSARFPLLDERARHDGDVRIARQAEGLARLSAAVLAGRGDGEATRRALAVQAARLARLTAARFAVVTGRPTAELGDA